MSGWRPRSEEHTSELQSRFGISYAVFCLKKKNERHKRTHRHTVSRVTAKTCQVACGATARPIRGRPHPPRHAARSVLVWSSFFFKLSAAPRDLPSSPTRLSSD